MRVHSRRRLHIFALIGYCFSAEDLIESTNISIIPYFNKQYENNNAGEKDELEKSTTPIVA